MTKYPVFTEAMKDTHTILVPDMLPIHFNLIISILRNAGYKLELLQTSTSTVIEEGLKNVLKQEKFSNEFMLNLNLGKTFRIGKYSAGISCS